MALGEILRAAREAKGCTPSEVAEATRMMVQMVEELEREDFRRIAAPIYGKGFIRLYAEFVELDPAPLIDEYVRVFVRHEKSPSLKSAITDVRDNVADNPPLAEDMERPEVSKDADVDVDPGAPGAAADSADDAGPDLFEMADSRRPAARPRLSRPAETTREGAAGAPRPSARRDGPAPGIRGAMAILTALGAAATSLAAACALIFPRRRSEFEPGLAFPLRKILLVAVGLCVVVGIALGVRHFTRRPAAGVTPPPAAPEQVAPPLPEPPLVVAPPEPYVD